MKRRKLLTVGILFCMFHQTAAQKGFLRGQILDAETGEALMGATVLKEGTITGTVADFDGNYSLSLEAGTHAVVFQFVSYQTQVISNINIKSGVTTILDMALSSDVTELEGVVITAEQAKDTEVALLTVQRKSPHLMDGISSQAFRRMGDGNLSSAMSRVTGVTVQGGKYLYVRGLGDRYTKTTLNDMTIPGLDPDRNAVQIDLFPTNTIENVVVYKTFSPDLPGDFTGGIVNVETKAFPEQKTTQVSLGLSYNPEMNLVDNFVTSRGGRLDFLAMDNGTRKLPFNKNTHIPDESLNDSRLESLTRGFSKQLETIRNKNFLNSGISVSHGNQIRKNKATLGYNAVLNYQKSYEYNAGVERGFVRKSTDRRENELVRFTRTRGDDGREDVLWSALFTGALKYDQHSFSGIVFRSQNGINQASDRVSRDFDQTGATLTEDVLFYTQRSITSNILTGKHHFEEFEVEWRNAFTLSRQYEPDYKETRLAQQGDGTLKFDQGDGAAIQRYYRDLKEMNESFKVDVTVPFADRSKFKFGGLATFKSRDFEVLNYFFENTDPDNFSGELDSFLAEDKIWTAESEEGTYVRGNFEPANAFEARQNILSVYAMTEMRISKNLRAIAGARAEKVRMFYTGQNNQGSVRYNDNQTLNELDLLPSLNLIYELKEGMNLRGSYNRTLARPSFKEKSIAQIYDPFTKLTFVGNIDLTGSNISNYDLRWDYFFTPGEMISLSAFYKNFDGHIELVSFETAPDNLKPRNAGKSEVLGVEVEVKKNLAFVSSLLANIAVGSNASFVRSVLDIQSVEVNEAGKTEYELRREWAREGEIVETTREMSGQSPYLINAFINYSNIAGTLNANLSYNVQGETLFIVGSGRVPDVYTRPFNSVNFNIYKKFGAWERSIITLGVTNILDAEKENVYRSHDAADDIFLIYRPGRTFSVKYAYTF